MQNVTSSAREQMRQIDRPSDDQPVDTRPFLCIPYWNAPRFPGDLPDDGELRPLPSSVISWDCQGIHSGPYTPGGTLDVSVDVRNTGGGNAAAVATVVLYWADPTVGFAKPNFFAATTVSVPPRGGLASTRTMSALIPFGAPSHICLLVLVTNSLDKAGAMCDPVSDRHWAQRNLQSLTASRGNPMIVPFLVVNPFAREKLFALKVRMVDREALQLLALRMKAEPSDVQPHFRLLDERGERPTTHGEREGRIDIALGASSGQLLQLAIDLEGILGPHDLIAVEAELVPHDTPTRPVGSLGIVIRGDPDS